MRWLCALVAVVALAACSSGDASADETTTTNRPATRDAPATTGATTTSLDVGLINLDSSWQVCSAVPDQVYAETGTTDPTEAAIRHAEGLVTPEYQGQAVEGCLAGLLGEPNPACVRDPDFSGCP